jgi:hypothetical protein
MERCGRVSQKSRLKGLVKLCWLGSDVRHAKTCCETTAGALLTLLPVKDEPPTDMLTVGLLLGLVLRM